MCILCAIQSWSRKFATMLPWLVIPLIGLWALSQLLPPAFRFEITSPRLACVAVLLVTLLWYEFLMPQLSVWRVRRNARIRERKRIEAVELQKLRKTATRRCRNCLTPYRDQNPGGGKFMCSYCGHISKRPVLDLPVPPGMGNAGILKDLVGKGGKILNGKAWSDNGWMCGQEWLENGNWTGVPFSEKKSYWKNGDGVFSGEDHCSTEKSYSRIFTLACKAFATLLFSVVWLWRKIFRVSSSRDDASADAERREMLDKQDENGVNNQESRGKKARRKAEEKRQARLEKELLEEEERKQREEVARLVEERRRLRDEKLEAEKEHGKLSPPGKERDGKKEAEKKCLERKKEKEKSSSKNNSERNKKSDNDGCEQLKTSLESVKGSTDAGLGFKGSSASTQNRGNAGTRYLDRMRGTFLSSSRAFSGGGFFGKSTSSAAVSREHKPNTLVDHAITSTYRKDIAQPERVSGRVNMYGDDKSVNRPVFIEPQPCTAPKKSWQQLFTRPSSVSPSNANVICRPNVKHQPEIQSSPLFSYPTSTQSYDNPVNFGLPFTVPQFPVLSTSSSAGLPSLSEPMFSRNGDAPCLYLPEESVIFEDPCYVADPISLLGPVSESLDNFQLDLGFVTDSILETPRAVNTVAVPSDVTKPSPIESPLSRSRVSEEIHASSQLFPSTPEGQDAPNNISGTGSWQMWNSPPLCQDSLGFGGGPVSWNLPSEMNKSYKEDMMHTLPHKTMVSLFKKDEKVISETLSPHAFLGSSQTGGIFMNSVPANINGHWLPFGTASINDNQNLLKPKEEVDKSSLIYGNVSASNQQFGLSVANSRAKKDWNLQGSRDGTGDPPVSRPQYGSLYNDVQSFWSYD